MNCIPQLCQPGAWDWTSRWFILEGPDGTGKTTVALKLVKVLRDLGYKAKYSKEPSENNILGQFIRCLLASPETFKGFLAMQPGARNNVYPISRLLKSLSEGGASKLDGNTKHLLTVAEGIERSNSPSGTNMIRQFIDLLNLPPQAFNDFIAGMAVAGVSPIMNLIGTLAAGGAHKLDQMTWQTVFTAQRVEYMKELAEEVSSNPGLIIIQDRSWHSSVAYVEAEGPNPKAVEFIMKINQFIPQPAKLIIFKADVRIAMERISNGGRNSLEHYETPERQEQIAKSYGRNFPEGPSIIYVDASKPVSGVLADTSAAILSVLRSGNGNQKRRQARS